MQVDYFSAQVSRGSRLIQCSDGLYQCVTEEEIGDVVSQGAAGGSLPPPDRVGREARDGRQFVRANRADPAR